MKITKWIQAHKVMTLVFAMGVVVIYLATHPTHDMKDKYGTSCIPGSCAGDLVCGVGWEDCVCREPGMTCATQYCGSICHTREECQANGMTLVDATMCRRPV